MRRAGPALAAGAAALLAACGDARPAASARTAGRCGNCHGSAQTAAPPVDTAGSSATTSVTVGAHQIHLRDTPVRLAVACSECHLVPAAVDAPGHIDAPPAEVTFGTVATSRGATPSWDRAGPTCSGVHCHGATMRSPPAQGPTWTFAVEPDPGRPGVCSTCHGWPPPPPHFQLTGCTGCHPDTVLPDGTIDLQGGRHIDGILQVRIGGGCAGCHGYPPATGAHLVHFGLTGIADTGSYGDLTVLQDRYPAATPTTAPAVYAFGCGHCHPLDAAKHLDSTVEVEVRDPAAPAGSLKARSAPTAAYAGGTCSGVYCHSSGQEAPSWTRPRDGSTVASPAWTSGQSLGCNGCHDNPPAYLSGGPGAAGANGHLGLRDDGYVWGHFGGMPGPSLYSKHGKLAYGDDASPITCQTCHFDTVDPTSTGPSGFYYLDTTGDYGLGGGVLDDACTVCHTGNLGGAPTGIGKILPLRHVNGTREVVFDARTSLPQGISWLPAPPNRPSRPYWASNASLGSYPPDTSGFDGTTFSVILGAAGGTPAASYDAPTKTCSSVACHLDSPGPVWGTAYGTTGAASGCLDCHNF